MTKHAAAAKSPRPTIGITLDSEPAGGWSNYPWYAVRENYCAAVVAAGGLPVLLPHEPEHAEAYLDRIDALLVTVAPSISIPPCSAPTRATRRCAPRTAAPPSRRRLPAAPSTATCRRSEETTSE